MKAIDIQTLNRTSLDARFNLFINLRGQEEEGAKETIVNIVYSNGWETYLKKRIKKMGGLKKWMQH